PVVDPPLGAVHNPIDAFIQAKLAAKGIKQVAAPADALAFLRRATFDLTGLPPTAEELEVWSRLPDTSAKRQAVYGQWIERLLASPRYGEQMARHWLDVVRYADTSG